MPVTCVEVRNQASHLIQDNRSTSVIDTLCLRLTASVDQKSATIAENTSQVNSPDGGRKLSWTDKTN
jgi:hypothetical protein